MSRVIIIADKRFWSVSQAPFYKENELSGIAPVKPSFQKVLRALRAAHLCSRGFNSRHGD